MTICKTVFNFSCKTSEVTKWFFLFLVNFLSFFFMLTRVEVFKSREFVTAVRPKIRKPCTLKPSLAKRTKRASPYPQICEAREALEL